jgi:hypothetical protein
MQAERLELCNAVSSTAMGSELAFKDDYGGFIVRNRLALRKINQNWLAFFRQPPNQLLSIRIPALR